MKLFDDIEAVWFPEENLIFVTHGGYLYYIYNPEYNHWRKYRNAGYDRITVSNYQEIRKKDLIDAMGGIFPSKETDFMRLCNPSELSVRDMMSLLKEDYSYYMSYNGIYYSVYDFLLESDICFKSYLSLKKLFDDALTRQQDHEQIVIHIKELCMAITGRDIFKQEIGIVDGHNSSSYFWIKPVRVIDYTDTNDFNNVAEMGSVEVSIEEDDVDQYLTPFLYKYYDDNLEANKKRVCCCFTDDEEEDEEVKYTRGFAWYLTHNFYTFDSVKNIIKDINDTIDALSTGRENEFISALIVKRGSEARELLYARNLTQEQIDEYNANRPKEDNTKAELIIDFYQRFVYRMEYMIRVGKEKGYDYISFMGP